MNLSEDDWRKKLTPEQYHVLRQKGTELPFTGLYLNHSANGMYACAACGTRLFTSKDKYESNVPGLAGWPSFAAALADDKIELKPDNSLGMNRTEVLCANCGSHLGHLFDDDSASTGKHYCINSCALDFQPEPKKV